MYHFGNHTIKGKMPLRINSAFVGMLVTSNGILWSAQKSLDAWNGGYVPLLKLDMCNGSGICGDGNEEIIAEHSFPPVNSLLQVGGGRPLVSVTTLAPQCIWCFPRVKWPSRQHTSHPREWLMAKPGTLLAVFFFLGSDMMLSCQPPKWPVPSHSLVLEVSNLNL
jgi:hypothetical protein